jgi:uncharacterized RDD family membrane protein YckC
VNRRLAAHRNRNGSLHEQEASAQPATTGSRAAEAAARVAARYAKAPSYLQMQAEEARVAVRAAEIATKVALEAQAAAESALAELHAASQEKQARGPAVVQSIGAPLRKPEPETATRERVAEQLSGEARPAQAQIQASWPDEEEPLAVQTAAVPQVFGVRWDPDLPVRPVELKPPPPRVAEEFALSAEDWWRPAEAVDDLRSKPIELAAGEPAHANLIQFPRELVATRKMRPRLAEGFYGPLTEAEAQLSIFEVDPASISTEVEAPIREEKSQASAWSRPEWSGMKLDAQPLAEPEVAAETDPASKSLPVAPFGVRIMAGVVDCALILASFVSLGFLAARNVEHPPTGKAAEIAGFLALILIGLVYYAFFFSLRISTPGMKYAGIGLCTFDDHVPTRPQLRRRLGAMVLSMIPVGLGVVWSIFDEDHLSWHDRYSQTYLRKH